MINKFQNIKNNLYKENINNLDSLYLLSLLHRYEDEYDLEKIIIEKALKIYPNNTYMKERELWHQRPIFHPNPEESKTVPRYKKTTTVKPTIADEHLSKLCFVSACNDKNIYFELLIELIESIKNTNTYKDTPFYILDLGLTDNQKHTLSNMVNNIQLTNWDIPFNNNPPNHHKCIIARAFLEKYFPNHEYYFWLDADSWIQNESSIDTFLNMSIQHGIAAGQNIHASSFLSDPGLKQSNIPPYRWNPDLFSKRPHIWASSICYKKDSPISKAWQATMREIAPLHASPFWVDQNALNVIFHENNIYPLSPEHAHLIGGNHHSHVFVKHNHDRYTLFAPPISI